MGALPGTAPVLCPCGGRGECRDLYDLALNQDPPNQKRQRIRVLRSAAGGLGVREYYNVWFTNVTGCALGLSDISWNVTVAAGSEAEALELGLEDARALNREFGMPPHGLRV